MAKTMLKVLFKPDGGDHDCSDLFRVATLFDGQAAEDEGHVGG